MEKVISEDKKEKIKFVGKINEITLSKKSVPEDGVGEGNQQDGVKGE